MMHLFVGRQWIGPHALPMGDMDVVGLHTFIVWLFTAVTGYGMLSALIGVVDVVIRIVFVAYLS